MSESTEKAATPHAPNAGRRSLHDSVIASLLGLCTLLLFIALRPIVGGPMNDDFSYARTAESLARTGHIAYNGWGTPIMLPQAFIGALIIRVCGFSYTALEWFGIAAASIAAPALYILGRRCGLQPLWSLLAVAIVVLNPIYLSDAPSFMNDVPSLLLLSLAFIVMVSALRTQTGNGVVTKIDGFRLAAATLIAIAAGANRQIGWIAFAASLLPVLVMAPGMAARVQCALAIVVTAIVALSATLWFGHQPYTIAADMTQGLYVLQMYPAVAFMMVYRLLNLLSLLLLPVTLPAMVGLLLQRRRPIRFLLLFAVAVISLLPVFYPLGTRHLALLSNRFGLTIYGQYYTHVGVLVGGVCGFEARPAILGPGMIAAIAIAGAVGMTLGGYLIVDWLERLGESRREKGGWTASEIAVTAVAAGTIGQILISIPWYGQLDLFDRYLLLLLPGVAILHAMQAQEGFAGANERSSSRFYAAAAVSGIFLLYQCGWGVASASEYFAYSRARMELFGWLRLQGVPRTAIDVGAEMNGDTQIATQGYVNNDLIKFPADAYKGEIGNGSVSYERNKFPAIDADYVISTEDAPDPIRYQPDPVRRIVYHSPLLPPTERAMYIYRVNRAADDAQARADAAAAAASAAGGVTP